MATMPSSPSSGSQSDQTLKLALAHPLTVFSSHRLVDLLGHKSLSLLGPSRIQEFHLLFIENPAISLDLSPRLNLASLVPISGTGGFPSHSCPHVIEPFKPPREGLFDTRLSNPDRTLFVDGSSILGPDGCRRAAYAVVTISTIIEANRLPEGTTSQRAELKALMQALDLSKGQRAIFLPMVAGISLASLVAAGIGGGALTHSVSTSCDLEQKLQLAIEASAASITSLQRQITSVARGALQNRRALDLLTADKGGTCLFLQEECCYYINETGLVEDNVKALHRVPSQAHGGSLSGGHNPNAPRSLHFASYRSPTGLP
ncbi:uncharacterized protein LOC116743717 [Phocoena sinus]|uniref:uncharacterized protein LOC116743717 n=1 Tax=Phocoena sinus TaxID=42100 RepID=UPI0013C4A541|nr:uncharacterized protein LOC116743717 [Phocoena sinus]